MGRKKKERPSEFEINQTITRMPVPAHVLEHFEVWGAEEYPDRQEIEMREKAGRIPAELSVYNDAVSDGYTGPLCTLSHSFVCKPVYLRLYRRRYKRPDSDAHFSNGYGVMLKGVKMAPEPGFFKRRRLKKNL